MAIVQIAEVMRTTARLHFGRILPPDNPVARYTSACLTGQPYAYFLTPPEVLVAYRVIVGPAYYTEESIKIFLYGGEKSVPVKKTPDGARFILLNIAPNKFVILQ